jgi:phospholipase/lecithinase/hemolysin
MLHQTLAVALAVPLASTSAGAFDGLIVFGDSLSDVGNVEQVTTSLPLIAPTPGPFYFDGRFTNGLNYVDLLADDLGLGPVSRSLAGGDVFAYGGALATGSDFFTSLVVDDVDDQVDDFLANRAADSNLLYVVYAGGNDVAGSTTAAEVVDAAESLAGDIARLYDAGGRSFLTPNLPDIGLTPRFNGSPGSKSALSVAFNDALDAALDDLETTRPDIELFRLDVFGLFNQATTSPAAFGLTNAVDEAAPGLTPGDTSYDTSLIAADVDSYLFWDDFHPTATGHALLADAALAVIPEPALLTMWLVPAMLLRRRR